MGVKEVLDILLDNVKDADLPRTRNAVYRSEWISVKDKLPNDYSEILILMNILFPSTRIGTYFDRKFIVNDENITKWVTHWHELPEPPKD